MTFVQTWKLVIAAAALAARISAPKDVGLIWPNAESRANSDSWLARYHDEIRQMRPNVLVLNFVNGLSATEACDQGDHDRHPSPWALLTPALQKKHLSVVVRSTGMRPIGTAEELERRRRRAVELMNQGESPTVIARILGVCRTSLYRWRAIARSTPDGLAATPHPGPKPRLDASQMVQLEGLLKEGAKAHGWKTQLWTADRVADLIERRFSIRFHPEHVRKILKRRLCWTSQKPQRKARERDEVAIDH